MVADLDAIVSRIPAWRGRELSVTPLAGGMTNASHLVTVDGRRYVVRLAVDDPALLGLDGERERHNAEVAAGLGVGPRVLAHLPDLGALVVEFAEGRTLTAADLRQPGMPSRLARTLRLLHGGPRFQGDFDMFRLIQAYLRTADTHGVGLPDRYRERLPALARIEAALTARPLTAVPCHNDLVAENVIDDGRSLRLVDWEYSGNGDPGFELGNACRELDYDEAAAAELAGAYFGGAFPGQLARLRLFAIVSDAGWALWAALKAACSRLDLDFGDYGARRWARAEGALDAPELSVWLDRARGSA
ncbi:MAG: LPS biosynthesis choline kinase [Candidatus Rokuibacteriota bacterium]|nr:MAG: LPS biosynthesis choline kinase [Candidatus Rokubacteria bacterium]